MKILETFVTMLQFKTDPKGLKEAEKSVETFKRNTMKIYAAVGSILGGGFVLNRIAQSTDELGDFARSVNLSTERLSALEYAAGIAGASADNLRSSLYRINEMLGAANRGMAEQLRTFGDYGIKIRYANGQIKDSIDLFTELNRRYQSLSTAQQIELGAKLGIDPDTLKLLQMAPAQFDALIARANRLGVVTGDAAEKADRYTNAMFSMRFATSSLAREIVVGMLPKLTAFFETMTEIVAALPRYSTFFKVLGGVITAFSAILAAFNAKLIITKLLVYAIPIAIGLLIAAVALLIDELINFYQGNETLIGQFEVMRKALNILAQVFKTVWAGIGVAVDYVTEKVKALAQVFKTVWAGIGVAVDYVTEKVKAFLNLSSRAGEKVSRFFAPLEGFFGGLGPVGPMATPANLLPTGAGGSSSTVNLSTGDLNITVPGGNADDIAANIDRALSAKLQNTAQNFNSRVAR